MLEHYKKIEILLLMRNCGGLKVLRVPSCHAAAGETAAVAAAAAAAAAKKQLTDAEVLRQTSTTMPKGVGRHPTTVLAKGVGRHPTTVFTRYLSLQATKAVAPHEYTPVLAADSHSER
jgi:hypothetical protein